MRPWRSRERELGGHHTLYNLIFLTFGGVAQLGTLPNRLHTPPGRGEVNGLCIRKCRSCKYNGWRRKIFGSFFVDIGSTDTEIPSRELARLGINRESKRDYELANGKIVSYDVGYALINLKGEKVAANVVFGDDNCEPLLGVTVLESAGFIVDPVHQVLRKVAALYMK